MGLTTASLHFYDVDREAIAPLLPPEVLMRENNAPWLDVLFPENFEPEALFDFEKLGKRITKSGAAEYALLFLYFNDELFRCTLFRNGRKAASCDSDGSWAKLGKALDRLFADGASPKAFRYVSRCFDLDEKVRLLEESVGTALLDCAEMEPRSVPRSDDTLRAVKARESALRKRPNQCVLTELPLEEWPIDLQAQLRLYQLMRPYWRSNSSLRFLDRLGGTLCGIPQRPEYAVFTDSYGGDHFLCCRKDSSQPEIVCSPACVSQVLWKTPQDEPVCLYREERTSENNDGGGWIGEWTKYTVACLKSDGTPRWRYYPPDNGACVEYVHTDPNGVITLFVERRWIKDKNFSARICRIDGSTGDLLYDRALPEKDVESLQRVEALNGFIYAADRKELVVLNDALEEVSRWQVPEIGRIMLRSSFDGGATVGTILWGEHLYSHILWRCDLRSGAVTETKPEIPHYINAVLPDGRFLGVADSSKRLSVFDPDGTIISRHMLKGVVTLIRCNGERIYVLEQRSPNTGGIVCEELFDETSFHLWRLDRA